MWYILDKRMDVVPAKNPEEAAAFMDHPRRKIAYTQVTEDVEVSTVFLCLDHGFGGEPLFFETMVFGGVLDGYQSRYGSVQEARTGHAKIVQMVELSSKREVKGC